MFSLWRRRWVPPVLVYLVAHIPTVVAQGTSAVCLPGYEWMENSKGQSPCLITSYLFTPCSPPSVSWVYGLSPGFHYNTPENSPTSATACRCSTVLFSTLAACATCQGQETYIIPWSTYSTNCSSVYLQRFPDDIPAGTSVPAWAYLDVKTNDTFSPIAARAIAEESIPESTATSRPTSTSSRQTVPPSASASSNGAPSSPDQDSNTDTGSSKKSNLGAIVGGVVGGVVGLLGIGLAIFFFLRHRRTRGTYEATPATADLLSGEHGGGLGQGQYAQYTDKPLEPPVQTPQSPKLYDPNDPSTFPAVSLAYSASPDPSTVHTSSSPVDARLSYGAFSSNTAVTSTQPGYKGVPEI